MCAGTSELQKEAALKGNHMSHNFILIYQKILMPALPISPAMCEIHTNTTKKCQELKMSSMP